MKCLVWFVTESRDFGSCGSEVQSVQKQKKNRLFLVEVWEMSTDSGFRVSLAFFSNPGSISRGQKSLTNFVFINARRDFRRRLSSKLEIIDQSINFLFFSFFSLFSILTYSHSEAIRDNLKNRTTSS